MAKKRCNFLTRKRRQGVDGYYVAGSVYFSLREAKKEARKLAKEDKRTIVVEDVASGKTVATFRSNPATTIRGWVKARAVKIVRNKRGQAVSVKIRT